MFARRNRGPGQRKSSPLEAQDRYIRRCGVKGRALVARGAGVYVRLQRMNSKNKGSDIAWA
jgi:hypothetical protein